MKNFSYDSIANTIRSLSMDAIQKAKSGHPGLPMGMADVATVLWSDYLRFNPSNPGWFNRDRFVLSGGHGSMLLYSLLHLYGYDLSLEEIKNFRQLGSKTPGHPEIEMTDGVETTTGPLGQGIANAVGMAIAETHLAGKFNRDQEVIDHYTYVMAGDGDLQEGVSHEACSLAGHLKLGKLILFYDSNDITIDGETKLSYTEDVKKRFIAYGWNVLEVDGHDKDQVRTAIDSAHGTNDRPNMIICKTIIGFGSPNKAGKSSAHGSPLGSEEIILTKEKLGISPDNFFVPDDLHGLKKAAHEKGVSQENSWKELMNTYNNENKDLHEELLHILSGKSANSSNSIPVFEAGSSMATRKASGTVLEYITSSKNNLLGGSADLTPSNNTMTSNHEVYSNSNPAGNYIHYGVREFGMGAIMNGIAIHGGVLPYGGTFFVFSDYSRPAIRMAALMGIQVIHVLTHDSIGLGEDGPTHQPVEHLTSLRAMPNVRVLRPADANETAIAWRLALEHKHGPSCLVLTRQNLAVLDTEIYPVHNAQKGAYVLAEDEGFDRIIIASGSEVEQALKAKVVLNSKGIKLRVVSMMCTEIFDQQPSEYRETVLPSKIKNRIAVEAGATLTWYKYVGLEGKILGMDTFGASAPADELFEKFGLLSNDIVRELS